ncbi:2-amino-4-hydroxy-6-hydroxymethyldihydropteridine diphosphokinase [Marinilabilia sp.]|uniref:2-amino-4-hydroxy-6- hydroxymethyldihydropteridine diphosphokinase n=1 Tax=Marinilabilia sp. TaxID=2021252 RepID=UPI0025BEFE64|nr:2-amino-4-hydroxy-6-hydroxymethyldihydropteridine diphosphokinase [Marinilabilia sp.]
MSRVILLLGGNRGDTEQILRKAQILVEQHVGPVCSSSGLYKSPPWGFEDTQWFLNQVVFVETSFTVREVLARTQRIEQELGRKKKTTTHYEGRPVDIDILFYDEVIVSSPELTVPHPRLHLRRFTLVPLFELAPGMIHPVLKESITTLLETCPDKGEVIKI